MGKKPFLAWAKTGNNPWIGVWGGYAFDSMKLWGKTRDATLQMTGIHFKKDFVRVFDHPVMRTADAYLYANYTYPEFDDRGNRTALSGFGFSPLGFQTNFSPKSNIQPFLKTTGGFMFLAHPFPDERGKKINFTYEAGGGFNFILGEHLVLITGVNFFHLSNAETGQINPGIDSGFIYFGLSYF